MTSGYSGTPLVKKLGIKPGNKMLLYNQPAHYFNLLKDLPEVEILEKCSTGTADFIHLFFSERTDLESKILAFKAALKKQGILWLSWPKGASKITTDLNREIVRDCLLSTGLVDIKVAAIDEDWSGLKFMYRKSDR